MKRIIGLIITVFILFSCEGKKQRVLDDLLSKANEFDTNCVRCFNGLSARTIRSYNDKDYEVAFIDDPLNNCVISINQNDTFRIMDRNLLISKCVSNCLDKLRPLYVYVDLDNIFIQLFDDGTIYTLYRNGSIIPNHFSIDTTKSIELSPEWNVVSGK